MDNLKNMNNDMYEKTMTWLGEQFDRINKEIDDIERRLILEQDEDVINTLNRKLDKLEQDYENIGQRVVYENKMKHENNEC
jgi:hypothetical protein